VEGKMEKTKRLKMDRRSIGFFKAILESYEDVGIFSVLDGKEGLIELVYPCSFEADMEAILEDMANYGVVFGEVTHV
jgi:hypothetical protein